MGAVGIGSGRVGYCDTSEVTVVKMEIVVFDEEVRVMMVEEEAGSVGGGVVEVSLSEVVEGPAASTTLIDTVETLVVSLVTVLRMVDAGCVTSMVLAGCVTFTVTVESNSVTGVTIFVGRVTVSVTSIVSLIVVSTAGAWSADVADGSELPSTATTEYRLSRKTFLGCEGREVMRRGRDDRRSNRDGRSKRILIDGYEMGRY